MVRWPRQKSNNVSDWWVACFSSLCCRQVCMVADFMELQLSKNAKKFVPILKKCPL